MPYEITRENLDFYQTQLERSLDSKDYNQLREVINFIRKGTDSIDVLEGNKFIFLVGATGAGKSTLLNYLQLDNDHFEISNDKGEIRLKNPQDGISLIGNGKSSTTLIPNAWKVDGIDGTFLDCAGEGDTAGVLAEIMSSMVKKKISVNADNIKIILVSKQNSLDSNGGYGAVFKDALDKNSQFFKGFDNLKDSLGLVVTGTSVKKGSIDAIEQDLANIASHKNFEQYKGVLDNLLLSSQEHDIIKTFSKGLESADIGDTYSSPFFPNQNEDIKTMIKSLPYTSLPKGIEHFDIPTSPHSREVMQLIVDAIIRKGVDTVSNAVIDAKPFEICSVEVKPFDLYLSGLINDYQSDFLTYCKILQYNNYFKIQFDQQELKKIGEDLNFVSSFLNNQYDKGYEYTTNWSDITGTRNIFESVKNDLQEYQREADANYPFYYFTNKTNINIKAACKTSYEIKNVFDSLNQNLKEIDNLDLLKNDQSSKYFKNVTKQVFSHYETEYYTDTEAGYWKKEEVPEYREKWFLLPVIKTGNTEITGYKTKSTWVEPSQVSNSRQVAKHKDETVREFDKNKYEKDLKGFQDEALRNKKKMISLISSIPVSENIGNNQGQEILKQDNPQLNDSFNKSSLISDEPTAETIVNNQGQEILKQDNPQINDSFDKSSLISDNPVSETIGNIAETIGNDQGQEILQQDDLLIGIAELLYPDGI